MLANLSINGMKKLEYSLTRKQNIGLNLWPEF